MSSVIMNRLTRSKWLTIAGIIDNEYPAGEQTFSVERKIGYFYLSTNRCDSASFIKVYCEIGQPGFSRIDVLGGYTDGWQEIQPKTYERVREYLKTLSNETI